MGDELNRKEFFKKGLLSIMEPLARLVEEKLDGLKSGLLRPPGAIDELSFIAVCTKCDLCKDACPYNAIKIADTRYGMAAGTPYIDPEDEPCRLCEDMPCIKVCEPGALKEVKREDVRIGLATIDTKQCLAWRGVMCSCCVDICPFPGEAISMDGLSRPKIESDRCTGCGLCLDACIAEPNAIKIEPMER